MKDGFGFSGGVSPESFCELFRESDLCSSITQSANIPPPRTKHSQQGVQILCEEIFVLSSDLGAPCRRNATRVLSSFMPLQAETRTSSDAAGHDAAVTSSLMGVPNPLPVSAVKSSLDSGKVSKWNTHNLGLRACADAVSAGAAGVLVAPIVCTIDR